MSNSTDKEHDKALREFLAKRTVGDFSPGSDGDDVVVLEKADIDYLLNMSLSTTHRDAAVREAEEQARIAGYMQGFSDGANNKLKKPTYLHEYQQTILNHMKANGGKVTMRLREFGELIGVASPGQVKHHLQRLVKTGQIERIGRSAWRVTAPQQTNQKEKEA